MARTEVRYLWRCYDPARKRYFTTRHHASAEQIHIEYPEATPVPGSEDVIELVEPKDFYKNSASHLMGGRRD